MEDNLLKLNKIKITNDKQSGEIIAELKYISSFLNNLAFSFFGKTFVFGKKTIECSRLLYSVNYTLENVIKCSVRYCISDSMTLLRKFKDDLWFVLYVLTYKGIFENNFDSRKKNEMRRKIDAWFDNELYIKASSVIKEIFGANDLDELDAEYGIKTALSEMANKMDNYVHSNGLIFYNSVLFNVDEKVIGDLNSIKTILIDNILFFLIILALQFPYCLSSSDYEDYSDMGAKPQLGCQYWIAPYIEEFFKKYEEHIDKNLKAFLKKESCLDFSDIW